MQRSYAGLPPVEYRFLGLDKRAVPATLAVLFVVVLWTAIVPAINEALDADVIPSGTVIEVGRGVTFVPAAGWSIEGVSLPASGSITIIRDGITFTMHTGAFTGSSTELLDRILRTRDDFEVQGETRTLTLSQGIPGAAVQLFGTTTSGAVFAFSSQGIGVEVDVEGPPDVLPRHTEEIGQMIASIRFPSGGGDV